MKELERKNKVSERGAETGVRERGDRKGETGRGRERTKPGSGRTWGGRRERKTTGTVSENRIRGEQVTGGRDPVGGRRGRRERGEFPPFQPPCCRAERRVGIRTH